MFRKSLVICTLLPLGISLAAAEDSPLSQAKISASDIVDKNVAPRGGLQSWRAVQTMPFAVKLRAGWNRRDTSPVIVLQFVALTSTSLGRSLCSLLASP